MIFIGSTVLDTRVAKIRRFYEFTIWNDSSRGCKFHIGEISCPSYAWNSTHSIPALEFRVSTLWEFIKNRILRAPFHFRFAFSLGKQWEIDKRLVQATSSFSSSSVPFENSWKTTFAELWFHGCASATSVRPNRK